MYGTSDIPITERYRTRKSTRGCSPPTVKRAAIELGLEHVQSKPCEEEPKVVGPCEALIPSWSFVADSGKCEFFNYGGCEGTANRFDSEADCKETCKVEDEEDCCPAGEFCCDTACLADGTQTLVPCGANQCKCDSTPEPCICAKEFAPVCDTATGTTYGNHCEAKCDNVAPENLVEGACERPSPPVNSCEVACTRSFPAHCACVNKDSGCECKL